VIPRSRSWQELATAYFASEAYAAVAGAGTAGLVGDHDLCARPLARELIAWVIVDVEREVRLRRQVVAGPEGQQSQKLVQMVAAVDL
jgi:hypothetical protein